MFSYSRRWFLFSCSLLMRSKEGGQRPKQEKQQMAAPGCGIGAVRAQGKWEPSWAKVFWRLFAFRPPPILLDCFLFVGLGFFPSVFFYSLLEKRTAEGENCCIRSSCIDLVEDSKTWCDLLKRWHEVMAWPTSASRRIKHSTGATSGGLNNCWVMQF